MSSQLTKAHKTAIKASWAKVTENVRKNAVDFLVEFFEASPEYLLKFRRFSRTATLEELSRSPIFVTHATQIVFHLSAMVEFIDDSAYLDHMMKKLGSNHATKDIDINAFRTFQAVLLKFLEDRLGEDMFPATAKEGWTIMLNEGMSKIEMGILEYKMGNI